MKKLYLLRHAQSSNPQGVSDHSRQLDKIGKQECKSMQAYLIENNIHPALVLCSDSVRTTMTAKNIFNGISGINVTYNAKLYNATPGEILKEIAKISDDISSIMLIAHNPGIQQLAFILAGWGDKEMLGMIKSEYPTCALTEYSFNVDTWKNVQPGKGELDKFITL